MLPCPALAWSGRPAGAYFPLLRSLPGSASSARFSPPLAPVTGTAFNFSDLFIHRGLSYVAARIFVPACSAAGREKLASPSDSSGSEEFRHRVLIRLLVLSVNVSPTSGCEILTFREDGEMGLCLGKCAHLSPQERQLWACCGRKIIEGLRDAETAQLLVFNATESGRAFKNDPKTEEEVFGYNIGSQKDTASAKCDGRVEADICVDPDRVFDEHILTESGEKSTFLQSQSSDLSVYIVTWNMNGKALVDNIAELLEAHGDHHDLYIVGLQEAHHSIAESLVKEALGEKYSLVAAAVMLSLQLFVIARKTILPFISKPMVDKISVGGLGGVVGRQKGAVAVAFRFKGVSLLFIACHLAPAVADEPGPCMDHAFRSNFIEQADMIVWLGDLNYRVEMSRNSVSFLISHKLEEVLWSKDQLSRALKKGQAFNGFIEGPLSFKPTYKFDVGTDNYDSSHKERVPSWTDRILYKVGSSSDLKGEKIVHVPFLRFPATCEIGDGKLPKTYSGHIQLYSLGTTIADKVQDLTLLSESKAAAAGHKYIGW
ncbi:hypothetical protein AXG93_4762s1090 [Marchantia polymorpha subsp. ruderalis]|uniref:Inositol polyphosphate-related phosphatase domain-containing protein n=1 Tax=Marchantia polymorpha subsp. ruderalis TaxID=1480154 RepID=A0A176W1K1_MARPO|nr:hypothetical protein AXG93_4762s1090 [Marchantia polymorpha subsp. ruderalis]